MKKSSFAAAATSIPAITRGAGAKGNDKIRIAVIGCGGRGTGAALNSLLAPTTVIYPDPRNGYHTENAQPGAKIQAQGVEVVALADLFRDRLDQCRHQLAIVGNPVREDLCFTGFDAYRKVLEIPEVNCVILASPPCFRPRELRAAVEADKHVFMEKPAAVDAPGVRSIMKSGEIAKKKGLAIMAGTVKRHTPSFIETIRRLHDGAIGNIIQAMAYFNVNDMWMIPREPGWGDMEWQIRNWNYYTWLSGDCIVEQHVHMLDVANWAMQAHPVSAYGMGGLQARSGEEFGHTYDHFAIEYVYPDGTHLFSQNRQIAGSDRRIANHAKGTDGSTDCMTWINSKQGEWKYDQYAHRDPYELQMLSLFESIRSGQPVNEVQAVAESTLTGIMGREAAYSGQLIEWDAVLNSQRDYFPSELHLGDAPVPEVVLPRTYKFY
ncbi:MAG: Gfo/Idh/MocA family oxidoreductase [Phycisphaerales bacterium]|nr:Gfo/Idh/MocA family oxidoreductase [Phycisphaerales bacterium]